MILFALPAESAEQGLPIPSTQYRDCSDCLSSKTYDSKDAALKHLASAHYGNRTLSTEEKITLKLNIESSQMLIRVTRITQKFHSRLYDMVEALANKEEDTAQESISLGLPSSLVQAFEAFATFFLAASRVMPLMDKNFRDRAAPGDSSSLYNPYDNRMNSYNMLVESLSYKAEFALSYAMKDIIRLIRTGMTSEQVNYIAVGPQYLTVLILRSIVLRNLDNIERVVDIYSRRTSQLVCNL